MIIKIKYNEINHSNLQLALNSKAAVDI